MGVQSIRLFTSKSNNDFIRCVSIPLIDDNLVEENETFTATLTAVNSNKIVGTITITIVIVDDDGQF